MVFLPFILGFLVSYIGSITPSMLNISTVKISLEKGKKEGVLFSLGIALVVIFQTFLALFFLKILLKNTLIIEVIQKVVVIIFTVLSFYFYRKATQGKAQETIQTIKVSAFLSGMFLSGINLFSIPFFAGIATYFHNKQWLFLDIISVFSFSIGAFLGTYVILYHYILFADKIKKSIHKLSKFFNYALAFITGIVALISFVKML